jgi:hypothetical protein
MKYVNRLFINFIIHDFKQIAIGIEPQEQTYVFKFIDYVIIEKITKGVPYIRFGYGGAGVTVIASRKLVKGGNRRNLSK